MSTTATAVPYQAITQKPIQWLWPHRIPRGKITLIIGDTGVGKSLFTLDLAARLSRALPFPEPLSVSVPQCLSASPSQSSPPPSQSSVLIPQSSLLLTAEDTPSDTIRPRLEAAGADLTSIYHLKGLTSLAPTPDAHAAEAHDPLEALAQTLQSIPNLALIVIDPITAFLGFTDRIVDRTRTVLSTLADLAEAHNAALVLTARLNKSTPANLPLNSLYRVAGSTAFTSAARAIHLIAAVHEPLAIQTLDPTPEPSATPSTLSASPSQSSVLTSQSSPSPSQSSALIPQSSPVPTRTFIPIKHNLGTCPPPLTFRIPGPKIVWSTTPASPASMVSNTDSPLHEAILWLHLALDDGPLHSKKLEKAAKENCISERLLLRAKAALRARCIKAGYKNARWYWRLPGDHRPIPDDAADKYRDQCDAFADSLNASLVHD